MNWIHFALLSAVFAGLVAIFGKIGIKEIDSTVATAARSVVMATALLILVATTGQFAKLQAIPGRAWLWILAAGLAGAASWLCYFRALQLGDASKVAPIDRLSVIVAVGLGAVVLKERVSLTTLAGAVAIVIGSILVARG